MLAQMNRRSARQSRRCWRVRRLDLAITAADVRAQQTPMSLDRTAPSSHTYAHTRRGGGAARAGGQHQQRHPESRRRARGGQAVRALSSSLGLQDPLGRRRAVQARRPSRRRASGPGPRDPADRPSRHRVRARQPVPEIRAGRRPHARAGPGIIDMKGGDVIMIQALKALDAAGALTACTSRS